MKTISQEEFEKNTSHAGRPERVLLELTYRCNFRCSHCYVTRGLRERTKDANEAEVSRLLHSLAQAGVTTIGFTGGEPLLRKDIFHLLDEARKTGFRPFLYTNASLITPAKARRLKALGVQKAVVSMHGATAESFERVTGIKGSFRATMKGMKALRDADIPLGIKSCAPNLNPADTEKLLEIAKEFAAHLRLSPVILTRLGGTSTAPALKQHMRPKNDSIPRIFPPCGAASMQCAVTPSLQLKPCPALAAPVTKAGTDFLRSFRELSGKWKKRKAKLKNRCKNCELKTDCARCPAETMPVRGCLP